MALLKPTNGSNADYPARVDAAIDVINNGNYPFPATQVPSADANTLDDYEEGTWTPTPTNLTVVGTPTYTGRYTKIGRIVNARILVTSTTNTSSTYGSTRFDVPFTVAHSVPVMAGDTAVTSAITNSGPVAAGTAMWMPSWTTLASVVAQAAYEV